LHYRSCIILRSIHNNLRGFIMGLLDGLLGNVLGSALGGGQQQQGGGNSALLQMAMQMLMHKGGGQSGGGLGDILGSVMGGGQQQQSGGGGGGIGDILGGLMGGGQPQQAQQGGTGGGMGGLGSLIEAFQKNGMGDHVNSWVGTGENMPVTGDQVSSAFGHDQISQMAEKLGMSHGDVSGGLAQMLPQLINHVTPSGQVPQDHNMITDALSALLKR
jgi:uncharacterized protein YidB (DUF937 family)